ncbi:MAG: hypothetical protein AUK48_07820 [Oscillatoriales cyanobacterium CG2_30_44_21]|nr:MAG: hypothetical protein AUK48_07820 [Oscillatoriales cyanobacterium CG2_30_44_21]
MAIDYDLVVLGMGSYAQQLVLAAAKLEARVAWVCHQETPANHLNISQIRQVFSILKNNLQRYPRQKRREIFYRESIPVLNRFAQSELLENVQDAGVDVIVGTWKFHKLPQSKVSPLLEVKGFNSRQLRARAYAIANDYVTNSIDVSKFDGLTENSYLTVNQLLDLENLPDSVTLIGNDSYTCEIAQAVNFLGIKTTLITTHNHILPNIDIAIARTLQAQLEIEGIEVYTQTKVTAIESIANGCVKIWTDHQILECDRLLLANNPQTESFPNHPHIYPCHHDLDIHKTINKTLQTNFGKSIKVVNNNITYIATTPPISQVGTMQTLDAKNVHILESSSELGLCKVLCDRQGQILGASILGDRSKILIEAINIAIQGKVKVQDVGIEDLQLKAQWQAVHESRGDRDRLKDWFTFRRDWNL